MMLNLTISARELDPVVTYNPFEKVMVNHNDNEKRVLFLAKNLQKEVMQGTERQQLKNIKKLKKLIRVSLSVLAAGFGMSPKALAATAAAADPVTPAVVMGWGLKVALISVSAGVAMSMTLLSAAGIYRMLRKREAAVEWTADIVRGLVQVLISVPVVYLLYYLAQILFKHLPTLSGLF
jgi:hypothetical protein